MIHVSSLKVKTWIVLSIALSGLHSAPLPVIAQAPPAAAKTGAVEESLDAIEATYQAEISAAEFKRLESIATLAGKKQGEESNELWRLYFDTVVDEELFSQAEKTAEKVLLVKDLPLDIRALAEATHIIAEARRGALEESLASVQKLFAAAAQPKDEDLIVPVHVQLGLVEVYLRTIVDAGRYDLARKAIDTMTATSKSEDLIEYLAGEKASLERIGKPVAGLKGMDVDGRPFDMAGLKGKPVLIVFWATWDEVSEDQLDDIAAMTEAFKSKGLEVVTINVDRLRENAEPPADLAVDIRRFLVERNLLWKSLISDTGDKDYAKTLGVKYLPSNIVVDKAGIVRHVDRSAQGLATAVAEVCK